MIALAVMIQASAFDRDRVNPVGAQAMTFASPFYVLDVIAKSGDTVVDSPAHTMTGMDSGPTVNDLGEVGFIATLSDGGTGVFFSDGRNPTRNVNPGTSHNASRTFGLGAQLSNSRRLVTQDRFSGSPMRRFIRNWDAALSDDYILVATAGVGSLLSVGTPSLNNGTTGGGDVAYSGLDSSFNNRVYTSANTSGQVTTSVPRPMVADTGRVVLQIDATVLRLYDLNLASSDQLTCNATTTGCRHSGFTAVGRMPGISDDGLVVAFYGVLSDAGAMAAGTTAGEGIFLSVDEGVPNQRTLVRVSGWKVEQAGGTGDRDGFCETGEPCRAPFGEVIESPGGNDDGICDVGEDCFGEVLGDGGGDDDLVCEVGEACAGRNEAPRPIAGPAGNGVCEHGELCTGFEDISLPGGNDDGICDAGERCATTPELGLNASGDEIGFASYGSLVRVGVVHQSLGPMGLDGDSITVAFIATPSGTDRTSPIAGVVAAQKGLWTVDVDVSQALYRPPPGGLRYVPRQAIPAIQVGDTLGGRTVTDVSVYDPIAVAAADGAGTMRVPQRGDHWLMAWVDTSTGNMIVRGLHLDTDQDGLLDQWETGGIRFDADATPDQILPGANPRRKDLYVEFDYMACAKGGCPPGDKYSAKPAALAVNRVINAFAASPVSNPDGSTGISLHIDQNVAEPMPMIDDVRFLDGRGPGAADDFWDLKVGSNAVGTPGQACGTGALDGHFGSPTQRAMTSCPGILAARALAFRYVVYGDHQWAPTFCCDDSTGIADGIPGNDVLISLHRGCGGGHGFVGMAQAMANQWKTSRAVEYRDIQAATLMHELGHALGLAHGGSDRWNCKPNYISIMSYSRQFDDGGRAVSLPGITPFATVRTNRKLDYARGTPVPDLRELVLNESAGIAGPTAERINFSVVITNTPVVPPPTVNPNLTPCPPPSPTAGPPPPPTPIPTAIAFGTSLIGPASGPIDWNANGSPNMSVAGNINAITGIGCPNPIL